MQSKAFCACTNIQQINTQLIAAPGPLLAQMPSGRPVHTIKPYQVPLLDAATLEAMRAPPDRADEQAETDSDDEATLTDARPPGAFPDALDQSRTASTAYY
jgi:hypothetical protein